MIESPLNYTGGKYRLLPQILPHFPNDINRFVDIFCGGCNVGCNVEADNIVFNDNNATIISLFNVLRDNPKDETLLAIERIIKKYKLSNVNKNGYEFYSCKSGEGLADYNRPYFNQLRDDFNKRKRKDRYYYYMFYVLVVYAFNNQIRFNSKGEYNLPVGKRDFNNQMRKKLTEFIDYIQNHEVLFTNLDFRRFELNENTDFIYADPPYLITCASYNENDGWNETMERDLLGYLDQASDNGIRFALSNVLRSKGKENRILIDWINANVHRYRVIELDYGYGNSNYHTKDKTSKSEEVLIVNY